MVTIANRTPAFAFEVERAGPSVGAKRSPMVIHVHGPARKSEPPPTCPVVGGFALTPGVPASAWNDFVERNSENRALLDGFIFADADISRAMDRARAFRRDRKGA
jgi:hypothetical protein